MLVAGTDLLTQDPDTVLAFQEAYIEALQVLSDPAQQAYVLGLATAAGITLSEQQTADWPAQVTTFAPFDGGFGAIDDAAGLGQLSAYLGANGLAVPDYTTFIAQDSLHSAQAALGLAANPGATPSASASPAAASPGASGAP